MTARRLWVGLGFAMVATLFVLPVFSQPAIVLTPATAYPTVELSLNLTVVSIDAEIAQAAQTTEVSIRTIGSLLEEIDFQLPVTKFAAIEQAIAQELNLAPATIHQLIRYRLN
jgi:hypothetical protein